MIASGTNSATLALIKATKGRLFGWNLFNPDSAAAYLQIFDAADVSDVTLGTTPPTMVLGCGIGAPNTQVPANLSWDFDNGIVIAATATPTGDGAPGRAMVFNLNYE